MKLNAIQTALLLSLVPTTTTFAAALDRSGQSIAAFLQPNNYFEAGITILDPNVSGKDISQNHTGNMANHYYSPNAALKIQATDKFSIGLIYDQPMVPMQNIQVIVTLSKAALSRLKVAHPLPWTLKT